MDTVVGVALVMVGAGITALGVSILTVWILGQNTRWRLAELENGLEEVLRQAPAQQASLTRVANKEAENAQVDAFYKLVANNELTWEQKGKILSDFVKNNPRGAIQGAKGLMKDVKPLVKEIEGWGF